VENKIPVRELNKALRKEVGAIYRVAKWPSTRSLKIDTAQYGVINLKTITLNSVSQLVNRGCPYFVAKTKRKAKKD
jgi:hypothetical protein